MPKTVSATLRKHWRLEMKSEATLLLAVALTLASCTSENSQQTGGDQSKMDETAPAEQQDNNLGAALDLSTFNVCELVPAELAATTVGGTVLKPSKRSDYGNSQGCEYEIDPSGPDTYEYAAIWLGPPSEFEDPQESMDTDRGLGHEVTSEQLDGLGDEAYVIHDATEEQSYVHVLLKDRMHVEVRAERDEDARKLAQLVLTRL